MSKLLIIIFIFFLVTITSTVDLTKSYLRTTQQCTGNTFKCAMAGHYKCCKNGQICDAKKSGISCYDKTVIWLNLITLNYKLIIYSFFNNVILLIIYNKNFLSYILYNLLLIFLNLKSNSICIFDLY